MLRRRGSVRCSRARCSALRCGVAGRSAADNAALRCGVAGGRSAADNSAPHAAQRGQAQCRTGQSVTALGSIQAWVENAGGT
jgi:hypothetical protein